MIDVTDFDKVEVRVGTVVSVKENCKARHPAYDVTIDFGPIFNGTGTFIHLYYFEASYIIKE